MKEPGQLLHNMSAPPRSVITFKGTKPWSRRSWRSRSGQNPLIIAFKLSQPARFLTPEHVLTQLGYPHTSNAKSTLTRLIDKRANELSIPDGCAVIECRPGHTQKWKDELAQLAVICKSSSSVWLRSKTTNLSSLNDRQSISLFLPCGLSE